MNMHHKKEKKRILELTSPQSSIGKSKAKIHLSPIRKMNYKLNNKSFENFSEEIISNKATCSSGNDNSTFFIFQNINILLYYQIQNIEILVNEDKTIEEFISFSLNIINEELRSEKKNFQFNMEELNKYCIKFVKENGLPNNDIPKFNSEFILKNCKENKLCIEWLGEKKSNFIEYNSYEHNFSFLNYQNENIK